MNFDRNLFQNAHGYQISTSVPAISCQKSRLQRDRTALVRRELLALVDGHELIRQPKSLQHQTTGRSSEGIVDNDYTGWDSLLMVVLVLQQLGVEELAHPS